MKDKITIIVDGDPLTHIAGGLLDFATFCGLDGNDPAIGQLTVQTPVGAKVNCPDCKRLWEMAKPWRESDFE